MLNIVHSYYSEYNKPLPGGSLSCTVNSILRNVIETYMNAKKNSEKFVTIKYLDDMPHRKLELGTSRKKFC